MIHKRTFSKRSSLHARAAPGPDLLKWVLPGEHLMCLRLNPIVFKPPSRLVPPGAHSSQSGAAETRAGGKPRYYKTVLRVWATFSSRFSGHLRVRPFPLILPLFVCIQLNRGLQGTICRPSGAARGAGAARRDQRSLSLTLALSFGQFVSLTTKKQDISNLSTETAHRHTHTH